MNYEKHFKVICFDADDTLWVNEPYYRETEMQFSKLLSSYGDEETIANKLLKTEKENLNKYGYGIKGFVLSMIETALHISDNNIEPSVIEKITELGKEMIQKPVELLDGITEVLEKLSDSGYELIIATKGDLLDQERKLRKSNLDGFFHHIEIMSDKQESNYEKLLSHLDLNAENFLMVGNSMKSDIIPVINLGGYAVHIPFYTTWVYEEVNEPCVSERFKEISDIKELITLLGL